MIEYQILVTERAKRDIEEIADYIEFSLLNPTASGNFLDDIEDIIISLCSFPKRHPLANDSILESWGVRYVNCGSYLVFYLINEETQAVYILRVLNQRRDWQVILTKED